MHATTRRGSLARIGAGARTRRRGLLLAVGIPAALLLALTAGGERTAHGAASIAPTLPGGQVRTYYIAADTVAWSYARASRSSRSTVQSSDTWLNATID